MLKADLIKKEMRVSMMIMMEKVILQSKIVKKTRIKGIKEEIEDNRDLVIPLILIQCLSTNLILKQAMKNIKTLIMISQKRNF